MPTLKQDKKYHHGDLRNELIRIAAEMLADGGVEALSLRDVAKRAGVSHNAPYQHFADKEALIAAIAQQGFQRLSEAVDAAVASASDAPARLIAVGRAYVGFMAGHPAYLQVMFGAFPHTHYPDLAQTALDTLNRLVQIVREGQADGTIRAGDAGEIAGLIWMTVHGLSTAVIAQKIPVLVAGEHSAEDLAARYVAMICAGISA